MKFLNEIPKVTKKADEDDDNPFSFGVRMYNDIKMVNDVDAYLDESIKAPSYYRNLLQYMRRMEEHDMLTIHVHSPGGYFDSTVEIIQAMHDAKGKVRVHASGHCASAATMIALAAPELIVDNSCTMMFHAASHGTYGKMHETASRIQFNQQNLKEVMKNCYEGFFTEDEFNKLMDGIDFYMNAEEIYNRLENRAKYQQILSAVDDTMN